MLSSFRISAILLLLLLICTPAVAANQSTEILWYGHSAYKITTPSGKTLLIDPWILNPVNPEGEKHLAALTNVDLVLITHGHFDHIGQAPEIFAQSQARLVAPFGLGNALVKAGMVPAERFGMQLTGNFGGEISLLDGEVRVAFIPALHDSDLSIPEKGEQPAVTVPAGNPAGFLITIKDGPAIYHTGDTDLFSDMALVKKFRAVDLMLVCIGDRFTMGPGRAAQAVELVKPKMVAPNHYGTFPLLTGTAEEFGSHLKKRGSQAELKVMEIGKPWVWK